MSGIVLHGYWRSSAAYRIRIALNLKRLAYTQVAHDLRAGEQRDPAYLALAPHGLVPAIEYSGDVLIESPAIMEWLEARWPSPPLLPAAPEAAAKVRAMAALVACDIHPLNNLRVLNALRSDFGAGKPQVKSWISRWVTDGFTALESLVARDGGAFAFGESPTLADCFVVPQVYNAERYGVDLAPFPHILAAARRACAVPEIAAAHPDRQPDAKP
jgi:maleylpyruvate isomerase